MSKKRLPFFIFWITQSKISQFQQFLVLIRRLLGPEATAALISAFVLSRLDYCNAVLASLLKVTIAPLQRVQNAAARLILGYILISTIASLQHSTTSTGYLFNTGLPINSVYLCTSFISTKAPSYLKRHCHCDSISQFSWTASVRQQFPLRAATDET